MQRILATKMAIITLIALFLLLPLTLISEKIVERNAYLQMARNSVSERWTGSQTMVGPLLVVPYEMQAGTGPWDLRANQSATDSSTSRKYLYFHPDALKIDVSITNDTRYKGIYQFAVYTAMLAVSGNIDLEQVQQALQRIVSDGGSVVAGEAFFSTSVSDPRGINGIPSLNWMGAKLPFKPGSMLPASGGGLHAVLPDLPVPTPGQKLAFDFQLELRGMEALSFVPLGLEAEVAVTSSWPHPEFTGQFLPLSRDIDATGYRAVWNITSFASNVTERLRRCEGGDCEALFSSSFGVKHIVPVDVYLQSERAVKYGLLFIGLSFVAFFIFEVLNELSIHPIQYSLVGFAIAIFYLLLLSLSEHIAFSWAYATATLCCVGLLLFYLYNVLGGLKHAALFSAVLLALYACLYVIISAEDFSLLMGSFLTFFTLLIVMATTRKIDWYEVGESFKGVL
jgi:inner membrane protein